MSTPIPPARRPRTVLRTVGVVGGTLICLAALVLLALIALIALFGHFTPSSDHDTARAEEIGAEGARLAETLPGVIAASSSEARPGDLMTGRSVFIHVDIGYWDAATAAAVARELSTWRSENEDVHLELRAAVVADDTYMAISARTEENEHRIDIIEEMLTRDGVGGVTLVPYLYEGPEVDVGDMSNAWLTMKLHPARGADEQDVEDAWASDPPTIRVRDYDRERAIDDDMGDPPPPQYRDSPVPTKIVPAVQLTPGERYDRPTQDLPREPYIDPDDLLH